MPFFCRNVAEALVNMDRPDEAIKLLGEAITFLQKTGTSDHISSENRYKRSHFFRKQVQAITFLQKTGTSDHISSENRYKGSHFFRKQVSASVPAVGRIFCESRSSKSDFWPVLWNRNRRNHNLLPYGTGNVTCQKVWTVIKCYHKSSHKHTV